MPTHPLTLLEPRLRSLLPAMLYASVWVEPIPERLIQVFEHLRTLRRMLGDYVPRFVAETPPTPGIARSAWQEGTLMFTDLAGFTNLMDAHGDAQATDQVLNVLNTYFAQMVEIISKSGGNLLEWTGDAMLVQFPADGERNHTALAVRAGLRMQRAMTQFHQLTTPQGVISLGMRIGLHRGRFIAADIGTPKRMEYVLLGEAVQITKYAEGAGEVGRVCLSQAAQTAIAGLYRCEPLADGYALVCDDLAEQTLGEYDIAPTKRRQAGGFLLDRSVEALVREIEEMLTAIEPLASFLPLSVLDLLVETAAQRKVPPQWLKLPVIYMNLSGISDAPEYLDPAEEPLLITAYSRIFALINAAVETTGGMLKNVTYDKSGSNILIHFGVTGAHVDDALRAARTALTIQRLVEQSPALAFRNYQQRIGCKIGLAYGPAFAAEIGEPRGRREFNLLGDVVNTAARLMAAAELGQILLEPGLQQLIHTQLRCVDLGTINLKGKVSPTPIFSLHSAE